MRTTDQINQEYILLCTEAGEIQFKKHILEMKISSITTQLQRLVQEHDQASTVKPEHKDNHFQENPFPDKAP